MKPKRLQREIKGQIIDAGIGTRSQQAVQLQHEQGKRERKDRSHRQQEMKKQFKFELKQQKRKEKRRGR